MPTDAATPSIHTISICGADWKHDKFNRNSATANFSKWLKDLQIHLSLLGLKPYIFEPLISPPSALTAPVAYQNWCLNDDLTRAVILTALDDCEYDGLDKTKTTVNLYGQVKTRAEGEGPVRMITLIQEVLKIQCSPTEPLPATARQICDIVNRIFSIQALDKDLFKCVILLNSLNSPQYEPIQAQVSHGLANATKDHPYSSNHIRKLLKMVQNLNALKSSASGLTTDTALAATTKG